MTKPPATHTVCRMGKGKKHRIIVRILVGVAAAFAIAFGVVLGIAIATIHNTPEIKELYEQENALPSQILDIQGRLITEFFGDEKRNLVAIDELPAHLIHALITREDKDFFEHNGVSVRGTVRAAVGIIRDRLGGEGYFSGGSTITQQLAKMRFLDPTDISITRKLREWWLAFQLERHLTKEEILEEYLNMMPFGHGTYGVEAASQFYFNGKSARDLTLAESAILVIQLASPRYSPIRNPNGARTIQREILDQMVQEGYVTAEHANRSYEEYWTNYDYTRESRSTAFFDREDQAPYFSEYVREELSNLILGANNFYTDGFRVHTTLNLDYQRVADRIMAEGIRETNIKFHERNEVRVQYADAEVAPVIDLLSLAFDIPEMRVADAKQKELATETFYEDLMPIIDMAALMFGSSEQDNLRQVSKYGKLRESDENRRSNVEGALITLENATGYITAMVGGSGFEAQNQVNRAISARVPPGSAFKPLYYSRAIDEGIITPATRLPDLPIAFTNPDGSFYRPENYNGTWSEYVLARNAIALSMNVPSLQVLDRLGFEPALENARRLLGIPEEEMLDRGLVRLYPVGLGTVSVAPIEMARAFAAFPNRGREVIPIAIRFIEDQEGRIIMEPAADTIRRQREKGEEAQIISPQAAYVMTTMLQSVVDYGTLWRRANLVGGFDGMDIAGKTGTTQNWSDAWTVGFTPYLTTAVWLGFDLPGNSLGLDQTGAQAAGPLWARYMKEIHLDLAPREFEEPSGIVRLEVTGDSGRIPPEEYTGYTYEEVFVQGTEPTEFDTSVAYREDRREQTHERMRNALLSSTSISQQSSPLGDFSLPELDLFVRLDEPDEDNESNGDVMSNPLLDGGDEEPGVDSRSGVGNNGGTDGRGGADDRDDDGANREPAGGADESDGDPGDAQRGSTGGSESTGDSERSLQSNQGENDADTGPGEEEDSSEVPDSGFSNPLLD